MDWGLRPPFYFLENTKWNSCGFLPFSSLVLCPSPLPWVNRDAYSPLIFGYASADPVFRGS